MHYLLRYRGIGYKGILKKFLKNILLPYIIYLIPIYLLISSCSYSQNKQLLTGADILICDHLDLLKGKSVGIVTNHTAVMDKGIHIVDTLNSFKDINITSLFGPEHGIRGLYAAGEEVKNNIDEKTGIQVYSLYGKDKKPTKEMLRDIDILIYDIQDVGVRFYTYISTLYYVLEAAAENNIPVIVLDRPNPIDGVTLEGPVLKEELKSFVGIAQLPVRYGMTAGELADFFSGEILSGKNLKPDLEVIKIQGWNRESFFNDYDMEWIPPSPNIPTFETALVYTGTCLIEGTNVSEGRGTKQPFTALGAPFINSPELIEELKSYSLEGVEIDTVSFTPVDIEGMVNNPKYEKEMCYGIQIKVTDENSFEGFEFTLKLLASLIKLYPETFKFNSYFDKLSGDKELRESLLKGIPVNEIVSELKKDLNEFKSIRKKYLLY